MTLHCALRALRPLCAQICTRGKARDKQDYRGSLRRKGPKQQRKKEQSEGNRKKDKKRRAEKKRNCRLVPFCSCFLAFCSAFISFVPFSFVLTLCSLFLLFFVPFSFVLLLVSLSVLFLFPFPSFCSFSFVLLLFSSSVRLYVPFSFRLLFFPSFGSFFSFVLLFLPVSLALLLLPLLFGPFPPEPASVVLYVLGLVLHLPCTNLSTKRPQRAMQSHDLQPAPNTLPTAPLRKKIEESLPHVSSGLMRIRKKNPRQLQFALPKFFSGRMLRKFTELNL